MTSLQDGYLIDVDINAKLAAKTIQTKILPIIHRLKEEAQENERKQTVQSSANPSIAEMSDTRSDANFETKNDGIEARSREYRHLSLLQKEDISTAFSMVASQLDGLWNSLKPEYAMNIVYPTDIPSPSEPPIPAVLSTMMTKEEEDKGYIRELRLEEVEKLSPEEEQDFKQAAGLHRREMEEIIEDYSQSFAFLEE